MSGTRSVGTVAVTGLGFVVGVVVSAPSVVGLALELERMMRERATPWGLGLAACFVVGSVLAAARLGSTRDAGHLEVAGVLACANAPLILAQALLLHPTVRLPPHAAALDCLHARFDAHQAFALAEAASTAALAAGAIGLLRSCVRWRWAPLLVAAYGMVGGALSLHIGVGAGALGLALGVFVSTAHGARGPSAPTARGARGLAVLAVAMTAAAGTNSSWAGLRWLESGPPPYYRLWPLAETLVQSHRALMVQLAGCAMVLAYTFWVGPKTRRSSLPVLLAAAFVIGGAAHLRRARIETFNGAWTRASLGLTSSTLCACALDRRRLPRVGPSLPETPLPWPLSGRITPPATRAIPVALHRAGPAARAPRVMFGPDGHAHTEHPKARAHRISPPDTLTYGQLVEGVFEAVETRPPRLQFHFEPDVEPDAGPDVEPTR